MGAATVAGRPNETFGYGRLRHADDPQPSSNDELAYRRRLRSSSGTRRTARDKYVAAANGLSLGLHYDPHSARRGFAADKQRLRRTLTQSSP